MTFSLIPTGRTLSLKFCEGPSTDSTEFDFWSCHLVQQDVLSVFECPSHRRERQFRRLWWRFKSSTRTGGCAFRQPSNFPHAVVNALEWDEYCAQSQDVSRCFKSRARAAAMGVLSPIADHAQLFEKTH